jgi:hypothetical protein
MRRIIAIFGFCIIIIIIGYSFQRTMLIPNLPSQEVLILANSDDIKQQANEQATLSPTRTPVITVTPAPIDGAIGPYEFASAINPLTGLAVEDEETLNRRPIIVKVSNSPALVRPQSGIGQADLVWEHYTEAGVTRFSALFYSQAPQRVGSIRSARLIDYELAPMYQGILAFSGGSIGVEKKIYGSEAVKPLLCQGREDLEQCYTEADAHAPGIVPPSDFADRAYKGVLYGRPTYYRDENIPVPHNMFVSVTDLWDLASADGINQRPDLVGMAFHPEPPPDSAGSGLYAQIRYETTIVEWHYEPESGLYYRSSDGKPHYDANLDEQVTANNVIVAYTGHYLTDIVESGWGENIHWSVQNTVWPAGDAILFRDGVRYAGHWVRPTRSDMMGFRTYNGELLYLKPGNTWIQLVRLQDKMNPEREWVKWE